MNGKCGNHRVARVWVECFVKGCKIRKDHLHCEDRNCLSYAMLWPISNRKVK